MYNRVPICFFEDVVRTQSIQHTRMDNVQLTQRYNALFSENYDVIVSEASMSIVCHDFGECITKQ